MFAECKPQDLRRGDWVWTSKGIYVIHEVVVHYLPRRHSYVEYFYATGEHGAYSLDDVVMAKQWKLTE